MATNTDPLSNNNSYVTLDATSIRDMVISRLNANQIFTDQNFQGSNISAFIDVLSYTFGSLLYYLNKTSSESMFSEAQIYENMNRIVKILNYNPKGKQAQTVAFTLNASLPPDNYVIPRYSYLKVGSSTFSFTKDIYFSYLENNVLEIQNPDTDFFLYQGNFNEYPTYTALGNSNEVVFLNLGSSIFIDDNNIDVYVKKANTNNWVKWERTANLFLNKSDDLAYEVRYNQNQNYEIKFGDNINGKQLDTGDVVLVYYLQIDTNASTLAANSLKQANIVLFNSINYSNAFNDTIKYPSKALNSQLLPNIIINNSFPSNPYIPEESVDQIRKNAPKSFSYQQRLVTANDFKNYILGNYSSFISDCYVVNNEDYLKGHVKYLYDIGIKSPQLDNSILYNQIKFSNSCNFNNIYAYIAPKNGAQTYVSPAQKEILLNGLESQKVLTSQVVPMDPVYMAFDFYTPSASFQTDINDVTNCILRIIKSPNVRQSDSGILNSVMQIIQNEFNVNNVKFGQSIDISGLNSKILNLNGIDSIQVYRLDTGEYINGLSFLVWNYAYPMLDAKVYNHNFTLQYFQYASFNAISNLMKRIKVVDPTGIITVTSY